MTSEPVELDFTPTKLPPDLLHAIGLMSAATSNTEYVLQTLVGGLIQIDYIQTRALTAHMSGPLRDNIIRALSELAAPSVAAIDELDDLLDRVNDALGKRNVVIHNAIGRHPVTDEVFSYRETARGSFQITLESVSVDEIIRDAHEIYQVGLDLMTFMLRKGITPRERTTPIRAPLNRKKRAREDRRHALAESRDAKPKA